MESLLIDRLATLSHPQRMAVFRLLMRRCPDELPAGEIAAVLALKASTASVYLSALTQVELITQRRDGTHLLYSVNLSTAEDVVSGLFLDCCRGRGQICPPTIVSKTRNVLFVCSGNSARSLMAEAILRDMAGGHFAAYSAGTAHRAAPHPLAMEVLMANGHDVTSLRSKSITELQGEGAPLMDFVFTVCDRAANEDCPTWKGQPIASHWGLPDPAKVTGNDAEKRRAFERTYEVMHDRLTAFAALPFDILDRGALQKRVDDICQTHRQEA